MSKSNYPLKAPASILAAARRAAARDGVSLNQFINTALAEKVAALEAEEVFTKNAPPVPTNPVFSTCSAASARSPRGRGTSCRRTEAISLKFHSS
jgi:hypothetical protein